MADGNNTIDFLKALVVLRPNPRPWHHALLVALCCGVPALAGSALGNLHGGLIACMGAMAIMYIPRAPLAQRMIALQLVAFGMAVCFALGLLGGIHPVAGALMLGLVAGLITFICRYYRVPPPGNFFFIMLASVATIIPFELAAVPTRIGLVLLGSIAACALAFLYSLLCPEPDGSPDTLTADASLPLPPLIRESVLTGSIIALSYLIALGLSLHNPYWVPISCAAVMQGASLHMVWTRKVQRILGTAIGLGLAWLIFTLGLGPWQISLVIILLSIAIESLILRNYGMAVIFITPLTMLFAELSPSALAADEIVLARLLDIVLGSLIGSFGGWVIYRGEARGD